MPYNPPGLTVTSDFGYRGTGAITWHSGVDYGGPAGSLVPVAANGVVWYSGNNGSYGNTVIIQSNGSSGTYYTLYAHLSDGGLPQLGTEVSAGDTIGTLGRTGEVIGSGPTLHFEVITDGTPISANGGPIGLQGTQGRSDPTTFDFEAGSGSNGWTTSVSPPVGPSRLGAGDLTAIEGDETISVTSENGLGVRVSADIQFENGRADRINFDINGDGHVDITQNIGADGSNTLQAYTYDGSGNVSELTQVTYDSYGNMTGGYVTDGVGITYTPDYMNYGPFASGNELVASYDGPIQGGYMDHYISELPHLAEPDAISIDDLIASLGLTDDSGLVQQVNDILAQLNAATSHTSNPTIIGTPPIGPTAPVESTWTPPPLVTAYADSGYVSS